MNSWLNWYQPGTGRELLSRYEDRHGKRVVLCCLLSGVTSTCTWDFFRESFCLVMPQNWGCIRSNYEILACHFTWLYHDHLHRAKKGRTLHDLPWNSFLHWRVQWRNKAWTWSTQRRHFSLFSFFFFFFGVGNFFFLSYFSFSVIGPRERPVQRVGLGYLAELHLTVSR